jgi:UDP-3-O-acyl N-acetylglucosamine deacetylase
MHKLGHRYQRTLRGPAVVEGVGYLTGAAVRVRFCPAAPDTGLVFRRTDLRGAWPIPAVVTNVSGANRRTTLGQAPIHIEMVEHILAALAGLRIDNCLIEINASETPGMDGSAAAFAHALRAAGIVLQYHPRPIYATDRPVTVTDGKATLTLYPPGEDPTDPLQVSYILDYGLRSPLGRQRHTHALTPSEFLNGLAECRTFLLEEEADLLRRQGLGARTTARDLLIFGPRGPVDNVLRFADEPARHKALDMVGDLALFGYDLRGHVVGYRSGHALNVALVRRLQELVVARRAPVRTQRLAA